MPTQAQITASVANSPVEWTERRVVSGTVTATPNVTGAKAGNTALQSLCAALVTLGIITDSSSA